MMIRSFSRRMVILGSSASLLLPTSGLAQSTKREAEGGIGGTGIVGILTEFGSLIVSGNYVITDAQTRYSDGFGGINKDAIRIGDSLTVEADGTTDGLFAKRVHVTHPLVGEIQQVFDNGRRLRINGVDVLLQTPMRSNALGRRFAISGLWRDNTVIASALTPARTAQDLVSGDVTRGAARRTRLIGGLPVQGRDATRLDIGSFATAIGHYDPDQGRLGATRIRSGRFTGAAGALKQLSIEGYLTPTNGAPGYRLEGLGHSFQRNLNLTPYEDRRVLFNGPYNGKFNARTATVLSESPTSRSRQLRELARKPQ